jgi:hypothetical protein
MAGWVSRRFGAKERGTTVVWSTTVTGTAELQTIAEITGG